MEFTRNLCMIMHFDLYSGFNECWLSFIYPPNHPTSPKAANLLTLGYGLCKFQRSKKDKEFNSIRCVVSCVVSNE